MHSVAIIGSGPTGIYTARYLLESAEPLTITMFEAQSEAGKGTPYHPDWNEKEMLSNIASIEIPPVTETLVQWLLTRTEDELAALGIARADITERTFFPRVALGEYFHDQLAKLADIAKAKGSSLIIKTSHKALDVKLMEEGINLTYHDGRIIHNQRYDYLVMATGHTWPSDTEVKPGYFTSPWPASELRTINNCPIGIRGTSLSAIDALVALAVARGQFERDDEGTLCYLPEPGTEAFHVTMMSRKGILPEADFYCPIPYAPLRICTEEAVDALIAKPARSHLLDDIFALFAAEIAACDPDYAEAMNLTDSTLEEFSRRYFEPREIADPFVWAKENLAEAKYNQEHKITVAWRYAILCMHEVVARVVPHLMAEDYQRFVNYLKPMFVDDYATVPHESIERLIALHNAGKLQVLALGDNYKLDTEATEKGALLLVNDQHIYFPAFIEATGQRALPLSQFPFKSLREQGVITTAKALPYSTNATGQLHFKQLMDIGGIDLDSAFHPVSTSPHAQRLYCLSLPFMLSQFPFAQGITSSHDMGKRVAEDMMMQLQPPAVIMGQGMVEVHA